MQNVIAMYGWKLFLLAVSQIIFIEANECVYNVTHATNYIKIINAYCEYSMLYIPNGYNLQPNYRNVYNWNGYSRKRVYSEIKSSLISNINQNTFTGVENVFSLVVKNSSISEIASDAFVSYTELNELNLSNNNITALSSDSFSGIRNLTRLDVAYNRINSVEEFVKVGSLMFLNVSFNEITTLNNVSFKTLPYLSEIDLSNNRINAVDLSAFGALIGTVNLDNNNISNVSSLEPVDGLKNLYLSNNSIVDIGELRLPSLQTLFLSKNKIHTLEAGVFANMKNLDHLDISENMISSLSTGTFSGLTSLRFLWMDHNRISAISGYPFHNTPNLKEISIRGNALTDLDVSQLTNAQEILLDGNNFTCRALAGIIAALKPTKVVLADGNHYDGVNIKGIRCEEDEATTNGGTATTRNGLEDYLEHGFKSSSFVKFFKDNFQPAAATKPAPSELLDLFKNLTMENNRDAKAQLVAIADNTSNNSKLLEQLFADAEGKLYEKLDAIASTLLGRSEPKAETENLPQLLGRIEATVGDERAKDKQYQDRLLVDLTKLNANNQQTTAAIGGITIIMLGVFMTIYIFFKWNGQKRNAIYESSASELNPII